MFFIHLLYGLIEFVLAGLLVISSLVSVVLAEVEWDDIGRGNSDFRSVLVYPDDSRTIIAGTGNAVLRSEDSGINWRVALTIRGDNKAVDFITAGFKDKNSIYAVTGNGLYRSLDRGKNWEGMPDYGLLSKDIELLIISKRSEIYAASQSGVFLYRVNRWEELSFRLTGKIRKVLLDNKDNLFAACDKGLFRAHTQEERNSLQGDSLEQYRKNEPSIRQV